MEEPKKVNQNKSYDNEKKIPRVELKLLANTITELRLKLQLKGFYQNQLKDYFFKPYNGD